MSEQKEYPALRHVACRICEACIKGEGEECHTPGCILWLHAVELPITEEMLEPIPRAEWVEVSERLPENGQRVWFASTAGGVTLGEYYSSGFGSWFIWDGGYTHQSNVTHWQPATIPEPPKGDA